jgi:hypothetical protein
MYIYFGQRNFRDGAKSRRQEISKLSDKNWECCCVGWNRTESIQVDCRAFGVVARNFWSRNSLAVDMSHSSKMDMYDCLLVRTMPLVHVGLGPNHECQQQCQYGQRNLDQFSHALECIKKIDRTTRRESCDL